MFLITFAAAHSATFSGGVMVVWPGDGLLLGLMLGPLEDQRWKVLLAGLVGALLAFATIDWQLVLGFSRVALMAVSVPCVYLIGRRVIGEQSIAQPTVLLSFFGICAAVEIPLALLRSWIVHEIWRLPLWMFWLTTCTATLTGAAFVTPLILTLTKKRDDSEHSHRGIIRQIVLLLCYTIGMSLAFLETKYPTFCLIPLALVLLAHVVDFPIILIAVGLTVMLTAVISFQGLGPVGSIDGGMKSKVLVIQAFLTIMICSTLPITSLMRDRERLRKTLVTALEATRAASQAKTTFLTTMSHEIRTPLNGVLGMAQAMMLDELTPKQRERIRTVQSSGEVLLNLLNDLLDISKIEAGKLIIESIDTNVVEIVQSVVRHNEAIAYNKGIHIDSITVDAEGIFLGDPTKIRQIIQNLVSNALKFTEVGSVSVKAHYGDGILRVSVKDTGLGIPSAKLSNLFQKFSQIDETTTRRFGGTGLGLSICQELAQAMGGRIEVNSVEGEGSTFTFRVPLIRLREARSDPSLEENQSLEAKQFNINVLAAEDNETNRLVLRTLLQAVGIEPMIVHDGLEAVNAWRSGQWDLILMDVQMPVMDGPSATRQIRLIERAEGRRPTPIVALSANTMDHQLAEYTEAGMDGHMAKPVSVVALFQLLTEIEDHLVESGSANDGVGVIKKGANS